MAEIIQIKTGTVQEVLDALQKVPNKNAILLNEPEEDIDPWPYKTLYVDGDFAMLSTKEYRKEREND